MANRITDRVRKLRMQRAIKRHENYYNRLLEQQEKQLKQKERQAQIRHMARRFLYE